MWPVAAQAPLTADGYILPENGVKKFLLVVKQRQQFGPDGKLTAIPGEIQDRSVYAGEPGQSSIMQADECLLNKTYSDVYLHGSAHAREKYCAMSEVSLLIACGLHPLKSEIAVKPQTKPSARAIGWERKHKADGDILIHKKLAVLAARQWQKTMLGKMGGKAAQALKSLPLCYEYAFGGKGFKANPAGIGYWRSDKKDLMPQIEWPDKRIAFAMQTSTPAGFSPVDPMWLKKPAAGNFAPEDMQLQDDLNQDLTLRLSGFFADTDYIDIQLPKANLITEVITNTDEGWQRNEEALICDSLIINTDEQWLERVFRLVKDYDEAASKQFVISLQP